MPKFKIYQHENQGLYSGDVDQEAMDALIEKYMLYDDTYIDALKGHLSEDEFLEMIGLVNEQCIKARHQTTPNFLLNCCCFLLCCLTCIICCIGVLIFIPFCICMANRRKDKWSSTYVRIKKLLDQEISPKYADRGVHITLKTEFDVEHGKNRTIIEIFVESSSDEASSHTDGEGPSTTTKKKDSGKSEDSEGDDSGDAGEAKSASNSDESSGGEEEGLDALD
eukprot:TRINITY_DN8970_c0_g1_i1.p1 TRINITY_DN8970_c0_g1~~TRINITY_DN8970_c0_g1_i1.p1  ORF type:complete len:223 (-),score=34.76 TRINITY_DN8970_c0_g1_i1:140-808(-)